MRKRDEYKNLWPSGREIPKKKEKGSTEKGIESIRFREREQGIDEKVKAKKK